MPVLTVGAGDEGESNNLEHHGCVDLHDIVHAMLSPRGGDGRYTGKGQPRSAQGRPGNQTASLCPPPKPSWAPATPAFCQQVSSASAPGNFVGHTAAMRDSVMVFAQAGGHLNFYGFVDVATVTAFRLGSYYFIQRTRGASPPRNAERLHRHRCAVRRWQEKWPVSISAWSPPYWPARCPGSIGPSVCRPLRIGSFPLASCLVAVLLGWWRISAEAPGDATPPAPPRIQLAVRGQGSLTAVSLESPSSVVST